MGAARLLAAPARRAGRRPRRPQRSRQDHAAAPRHRPASPGCRCGTGAGRDTDRRRGNALARRLRGAGRPAVPRLHGGRADHHGRQAQPQPLGQRAGLRPAQQPRHSVEPPGRQAVRRAARAGGALAGPGQAARPAAARRAGGQPRPAGPARVSAGADGRGGPGRHHGPAVLAPRGRPRTGLRLPHRAARRAGPGARRGGRAAGRAQAPRRPAPRGGQHRRCRHGRATKPHRQAVHIAGTHQRHHPRSTVDGTGHHTRGPGAGLPRRGVRGRAARPDPHRYGGTEMIWLTWRQHRKQLLFTVLGLAVLAALMVPTGRQMHRAYVDTGLADCLHKLGRSELIPVESSACRPQLQQFNNKYENFAFLGALFVFLPLLVGMFFGGPLVAREVEHGTHRLVWTQGVSRLRWAIVKFGLVGASALAVATAYALLLSWWFMPLNHSVSSRLSWLFFDVQGIVPVAYTLFAVALGTFAGTVWRRVLPAMAVTLVGFLGLRIAVAVLARPRFRPTVERRFPVLGTMLPNPANDDWVMSQGIYTASGKLVASDSMALCGSRPGASPSPGGLSQTPSPAPSGPQSPCAEYGVGAYNAQTYQPGGRFWLFQYIEAGLFVALAALLLSLAVRQVRRRIS